MNDRELLEFAAKAAGLDILLRSESAMCGYQTDRDIYILAETRLHQRKTEWNPLTNDGDALRLAVRLNIFHENIQLFYTYYSEELLSGNDKYAAARRAIVRAASEIGK